MKKIPLRITALIIMLIYSAMAISPLAAFAAKPELSARAVIVECSGDCALCGCSPERSASHNCCCWQKKLTSHCNMEDHSTECGMETEPDKSVPVLSTCPCGSKKLLAFWGENEYQLLPDQFTAALVLLEKPLVTPAQERLISRNCEPPDQPPELSTPA